MPKTLLLADDSITIQKVVGITFANEDVTLITVDNGDEAITRAREVQPDLVLADVVMPGKNGYEVCETLKADASLAHVPVVLLSGTFEAFDEERATRIGANGHITKPFEAQALVETVRQLLEPSAEPAPPTPAEVVEDEGPLAEETVVAEADTSFDFLEAELDEDVADGLPSTMLDPLETSTPDFGDDALTQFSRELGDSTPDAPEDSDLMAAAALDAEAEEAPDVDDWLSEDEAPRTEPPAASASPESTGPGGFDFDFDAPVTSDVPESHSVGLEGDGGALVSPEDLARETLVNPSVADAYAVSSSDLVEMEEPGSDPLGVTDPALTPAPAPEATRLLSPEPGLPEFDESPFDDVMPGAEPSEGDTAERAPWVAEVEEVPPPTLEETPPPDELIADHALEAPTTVVAAPPAQAGDTAPGGQLPDLSPLMRQQLHDTLEKIAWEAFGDIAERIVPRVLEQAEAIAWEVIPRMAEALVQEEIRKLKGEEE